MDTTELLDDPASVIGEMQTELLALPEDAPASERVGVVFRTYSRVQGESLPSNPSPEQREAVSNWLHAQSVDDLAVLGLTRRPIWRHLVHTTLASKAESIAALACPSCGPRRHRFPVDVDPWSAQSEKKLKVKIREGAAALLEEAHTQSSRSLPLHPTAPICISITAVMPMKAGSSRVKDADNLVKGLLDALAGIVYTNDSQVQCLTVRRLEHAGTHGFYIVALREAEALENDVIFDDPAGPVIAWGARPTAP